MILPFVLRRSLLWHLCRGKHIFNKYAIPHRRIVYHNVGDRADELAVLDYGATRHECVQVGTTLFINSFVSLGIAS